MAPTRDDAWQLLCEWTQGENLRRHGLAVEAAVAWYGEHRFGSSGAELETLADGRPAARLRLRALSRDATRSGAPRSCGGCGYPEEVVEAVLGHGDHTGVPRTSRLAHAVYACDEMSGFVVAVALVRPNRSLDEVDVAAVAQEDEGQGLRPPGATRPARQGRRGARLPFEEHVANVIDGLRTVREELGL